MDRRRIGALAATIVLVAACGDPVPTTTSPLPASAAPPPTAAPTPSPSPEPTLTVALEGGLVGGLSNAADGAATVRAATFLYDGLYALGADLAPVPVLAEGPPSVAADGLTWTVRLRGGVTFHDGGPLTSADVVQTYEIARSADCAFDGTLCLGTVLESVAAVDQATVTFTLDRKLAAFATTFLGRFIESKAATDASYARFREGASALSADELTTFLDAVAAEEARPTGPDGPDDLPTPDYARFREDGEALLAAAAVDLPDEAQYRTGEGGDLDVSGYVREVVARIRAIDAGITGDAADGIAAAYPYLDVQRNPVGTGPFRFEAFREGEALEFVANDDYFLGPPAVRRIVLPIMADASERASALVDGSIDWDPALAPTSYDEIADDPALQFVEYPDFGFLGLYFNVNPEANGLFIDRDLRQAVSYCFDKDAAVSAAMNGDGRPIYSEIPTESWAYPAEGLNTYPMDRARAIALIEGAGWTLGDDGIYERGGSTPVDGRRGPGGVPEPDGVDDVGARPGPRVRHRPPLRGDELRGDPRHARRVPPRQRRRARRRAARSTRTSAAWSCRSIRTRSGCTTRPSAPPRSGRPRSTSSASRIPRSTSSSPRARSSSISPGAPRSTTSTRSGCPTSCRSSTRGPTRSGRACGRPWARRRRVASDWTRRSGIDPWSG